MRASAASRARLKRMRRRRPSYAVAAKAPNRRHGRLGADELAEAVVLADLSLMLTIVGQFVPLGTVLIAAAVVPMAVLAARHRLRAVLVGGFAAATGGSLSGSGCSSVWCSRSGSHAASRARRCIACAKRSVPKQSRAPQRRKPASLLHTWRTQVTQVRGMARRRR